MEKLPVQWVVQNPEENRPMAGSVIESPVQTQREAPLIRGASEITQAIREHAHRKGRSCGNCRYFSGPDDPDVHAITVKTHAIEVIEKEANIGRRYALPLMQGICHLETKLSARGGKLSYTRSEDFCDNHTPKNRFLSFFGMGRTR